MGQKIHPTAFRLGVIYKSDSCWYPDVKHKQTYAKILASDIEIRECIKKSIPNNAALSRILIDRPGNTIRITLKTAKPGVIIGRNGEGIEALKSKIINLTGNRNVIIDFAEIRKPELDATLVGASIAQQLEKRISFRRAMKKAVSNTMKSGAKGIKVEVSGRLGGAEIARSEKYHEGRVPLHTLRADIDYATAEAKTTYGIIGVKVWIFKGEVIRKDKAQQN